MKITGIKTIYFSPCGATKSVAEFIGNTIAGLLNVPNEIISYTLPEERKHLISKYKKDSNGLSEAIRINSQGDVNNQCQIPKRIGFAQNNDIFEELDRKVQENQMNRDTATFKNGELVIWATPVYAGRIPNKTLDFVKETLTGNGTLAIPVVVFGNRSFDNALAELTGIMKDNGLRPIAGAAIVARHAFNRTNAGMSHIGVFSKEGILCSNANDNERISKDGIFSEDGALSSKIISSGARPSKADFEEIKEFCTYVADCIKNNHELNYVITAPGEEHPDKYYTPLKEDGTPANFLKAKPKIMEELCVSCGICSEVCPMGSIDFEHEDMFAGLALDTKAPNSSETTSDIQDVSEKNKNKPEGVVDNYNDQRSDTEDQNNHGRSNQLFASQENVEVHISDNGKLVSRHPKFTGICIKCQACIRNCPSDALYFDDDEFLSHVRMLRRDYSKQQENCFIC